MAAGPSSMGLPKTLGREPGVRDGRQGRREV